MVALVPLVIASWPAGVRAVCTTRGGGSSLPPYAELNLGTHVGDDPRTVRDNRAAVAAAVGLSPQRLVFMEQTHSAEVAVVDRPPEAPPVVDALVTATAHLAVVVMVADCVPVLLADPYAPVVAAAHAGRRGLAAGVIPATLDAMRELGARPERMHAWLGPAIGGCCYEVPEDMRAEVAAVAPGTVAAAAGGGRSRTGAPALDLPGGVAAQLDAAGVAHVGHSGVCTAEDPDFFSHRRDRNTGRFAALAWLEP